MGMAGSSSKDDENNIKDDENNDEENMSMDDDVEENGENVLRKNGRLCMKVLPRIKLLQSPR